MPKFEYYEPKNGAQWGDVPPTAIYPFEVDQDMPFVYFRDTAEPNCNIPGQKYIIFYYDSPKSGELKSSDGKPIFVPYILLVNEEFSRAVSNFVDIPVYNPVVRKTVYIRSVRKYKKRLRPRHKKHHKHGKKGAKSHKGGEHEHKQQSMAGPKNHASSKQRKLTRKEMEEKWKKKLEMKKTALEKAKKLAKARKYAMRHIDYWRAFDDRDMPDMQIYSERQAKKVINGGYNLGVNRSMEYLKPEDINKYHLQNSIMFPPTYTNDAEMPQEAIVNYMDLQDSVIARVIPPEPLVIGAKYTFFYVAPTKFKYPDGRKVWLPVYILVPEDSREKPTDLREFDSYKVKEDGIGGITGEEHTTFMKSKQKPIWTSRTFKNMIMNQKFINLPQKPMEPMYFLGPKTFRSFLDEFELVNEGIKFKERKNTNVHSDPIKLFLKNVMDTLSMKQDTKSDVMGNFANHNAQKFKKIMEAAKRQRISLVNNLKRKTAIERNLMKKRVMELNNKLKALKKIYKAQKKKLKKGKKLVKGPEADLHDKPKKKGKGAKKGKKDKKGAKKGGKGGKKGHGKGKKGGEKKKKKGKKQKAKGDKKGHGKGKNGAGKEHHKKKL